MFEIKDENFWTTIDNLIILAAEKVKFDEIFIPSDVVLLRLSGDPYYAWTWLGI